MERLRDWKKSLKDEAFRSEQKEFNKQLNSLLFRHFRYSVTPYNVGWRDVRKIVGVLDSEASAELLRNCEKYGVEV